MLTFTCITETRDGTYVTQHDAADPVVALRQAIGSLPFDDGLGPFDDEHEWLRSIANGELEVKLLPVGDCKNTWVWVDRSRSEHGPVTYLVQTDSRL